jgi:hypothetical protein
MKQGVKGFMKQGVKGFFSSPTKEPDEPSTEVRASTSEVRSSEYGGLSHKVAA